MRPLLALLFVFGCAPDETAPTFGESNGLAACTDEFIASNPGKECITFRALTGASMGGGAAARIGFAHPELFDTVGVLGTPLADLDALWDMVRTNHLAGFCTLEELQTNPDSFCGVHDI